MSEIEINKEDLYAAISTFTSAIDSFENDVNTFEKLAANLDGQNSNFVNEIKKLLGDLKDHNSKNLKEQLNQYRDNVKMVVDGFTDEDEGLANSFMYKNNPLYNQTNNNS